MTHSFKARFKTQPEPPCVDNDGWCFFGELQIHRKTKSIVHLVFVYINVSVNNTLSAHFSMAQPAGWSGTGEVDRRTHVLYIPGFCVTHTLGHIVVFRPATRTEKKSRAQAGNIYIYPGFFNYISRDFGEIKTNIELKLWVYT